MGGRLDLHEEMKTIIPNVYFQAPSDEKMAYPCVVYRKSDIATRHASNSVYYMKQEYTLTIMDWNPDNDYPDKFLQHFEYCKVDQFYVVNNLHHVTLTLYY